MRESVRHKRRLERFSSHTSPWPVHHDALDLRKGFLLSKSVQAQPGHKSTLGRQPSSFPRQPYRSVWGQHYNTTHSEWPEGPGQFTHISSTSFAGAREIRGIIIGTEGLTPRKALSTSWGWYWRSVQNMVIFRGLAVCLFWRHFLTHRWDYHLTMWDIN